MTRLFALLLLLIGDAAAAQPLADLAEIDRAVAAFTRAEQGTPGGAALPVDRRLRLATCPVPLALGWYGTRQDTVTVACPAPGGWRLFVPVIAAPGTAAAIPVVQRGDAVTITASGDGFAVTQAGEALEAGAVGAWIRVRGAAQGSSVLRARVLRPGQVGIAMP